MKDVTHHLKHIQRKVIQSVRKENQEKIVNGFGKENGNVYNVSSLKSYGNQRNKRS